MRMYAALVPLSLATFGTGAIAGGGDWDWQLGGPHDFNVDVGMLDLDPDEVTAPDIAALNGRGVRATAYVSVGTLEDWRADFGDFPAKVVGKAYDGWPGENFLDIRDIATLEPIMRARFETAAAMGFAAIEPDNLDVHINESGFGITAAETVTYAKAMARIAHEMGLEIAEKNLPDLVPQLAGTMDFMIAEDCFADGWCEKTRPFIERGKPVYDAEYTDTGVDWGAACSYAKSVGISMILHNRDLAGPALDHC